MTSTTDRYTIISADCHAGGNHVQYREYLDPAYLDDFDAWRGKYRNPFRDLQDDGRSRNWDDARRNADLDAEGVAAEVVFPNTVPPFFPTGVVVAPAPAPDEFVHRLAGIRAHNRWLADFVAVAFPERRYGQGQIFVNDVDEAVARTSVGARSTASTGCCSPVSSPDTPWIKPLSSTRSTTRSGRCVRNSTCRSPTTAAAAVMPDYGEALVLDQPDVRDGSGLLRQPGAVALHLCRASSSVSRT